MHRRVSEFAELLSRPTSVNQQLLFGPS
jgi:hypothetical protein